MRASSLGLREIRIHFGPFDFTCICLVGPYDRVGEFVAWKFDDPTAQQNIVSDYQGAFRPLGRCFYRPGYVPILWLPKRPRTGREHATLAHEMMHVVGHLMEWAAIPYSRDSEEVWCHALGYGVATLLNALGKKR